MKIMDTVPYFFENYETNIHSLRKYFAEFPVIFEEYFNRHCKDTEGIATYLSRQIAENIHPSVYFSYNDEGEGWLDFAIANTTRIRQTFNDDYETLTSEELFREWFSINGGRKFGYSRLAYFLDDLFVQEYQEKHGELATIIAWKEEGFEAKIAQWQSQEGADIVG